MKTLNLRRNDNNPTHRNEMTDLGQFYYLSSDDSNRVTPDTISLLTEFYRSVMDEILINQISIIPCQSDVSYSAENINNGVLPIFVGGSQSVLGINTLLERSAHDWCHYMADADLSLSGEMEVFHYTASMVSLFGRNHHYNEATVSQAVSVLYSEIYLQAAAREYLGYFPAVQKIVLTHTPFRG